MAWHKRAGGATMTEQDIIRVLSKNHSVGTKDIRDTLLARCLAVIGSKGQAGEFGDGHRETSAGLKA